MGKVEDLYAALGYGKFSARQVLQKSAPDALVEEPPAPPPTEAPTPGQQRKDDDSIIRVHGLEDILVYRAKCCNPIKGDAIVGYVTRGKGIAVHSRACPNVQNLMYDSERKIEVEWERNTKDTFPVRIIVRTDDRPGLLHQLTTVLANENTNVRSLEAKADFGEQRLGVGRDDGGRSRQEAARKALPCHAPHLRRARRGANEPYMNRNDPEHIAVSKSKGIEIDWKDGHHSSYGASYLRDWCPCATCTGALTAPSPARRPLKSRQTRSRCSSPN